VTSRSRPGIPARREVVGGRQRFSRNANTRKETRVWCSAQNAGKPVGRHECPLTLVSGSIPGGTSSKGVWGGEKRIETQEGGRPLESLGCLQRAPGAFQINGEKDILAQQIRGKLIKNALVGGKKGGDDYDREQKNRQGYQWSQSGICDRSPLMGDSQTLRRGGGGLRTSSQDTTKKKKKKRPAR